MAIVKALKHIGQTLFMILLVSVIALLPPDKSAPIVMPIVWGLIALILVGIGIYVWKERKKGLFCIVLMGLICGVSTVVLAQAEGGGARDEDAEFSVDALVGNSGSWCSAAKSLDNRMEDFIKRNEKPLEQEPYKTAYEESNRYVYAYDLAVARGDIEETHWYDYIFGRNQYDQALKCAKQMLDAVAEYKTKSNEMAVSTVRRVLEKDQGTCWPCGISILTLNIMEEIIRTDDIADNLRSAAFDLVGIMFLFWIAYKVVVLIGQWGTANISEFFTQFLTRVIVVMFVSAILTNLNNLNSVYSTIVSPFISVTAGITKKVVRVDSNPDASTMAVQIGGDANLLQCACCTSGNETDCNGGTISDFKTRHGDTTLIDKEAKRELMCMTCSIYKQTAPMIAIGRVLTYSSTHLGFWARMGHGAVGAGIGLLLGSPVLGAAVGAALPWPLGMWFVGMGLIVVFTIISALVAFKLMDIFLKLGFVLLLTPFLVATFAFPSTRTYTKRGWDFLVNAMLNILALGIGMTFVLVCYQTSLPANTTGALRALVAEAGDPPNDYAKDLYEAFIGGQSGAFGTFFILTIFLFFGMKVLDASQVIIEALSETSSGIPAIAGAAVTAALRAATAPIRMGLTAVMDHAKVPDVIKDRLKKPEDQNPNDDKPGVFSKLGEWTGDKAGTAAGKATEKTQRGVGALESKLGQGMTKLGAKLCPMGYGLGSIAGVPLALAGAGLTAKGEAMKATAKATGEGVKKTTKASFKQAGKRVQKKWNRTKRKIKELPKKIKNRIKQIPSDIKRKMKQGLMKIKNAPKHLKNKLKRALRRKKAKNKYGKNQMSRLKYAMLRGTRNTMDDLLDQADSAVGNEGEPAGETGGPAAD